jgi:hypothetical protein
MSLASKKARDELYWMVNFIIRYTKKEVAGNGGRGSSYFMLKYSEEYFNTLQNITWECCAQVLKSIPDEKIEQFFQPVSQVNISVIKTMKDAGTYLRDMDHLNGIGFMYLHEAKKFEEVVASSCIDKDFVFDAQTNLFDPDWVVPLTSSRETQIYSRDIPPKPFRLSPLRLKTFLDEFYPFHVAKILTAVAVRIGLPVLEKFGEVTMNDIIDHRMFVVICIIIGTIVNQWSSQPQKQYLQNIMNGNVKNYRIFRNPRHYDGNLIH